MSRHENHLCVRYSNEKLSADKLSHCSKREIADINFTIFSVHGLSNKRKVIFSAKQGLPNFIDDLICFLKKFIIKSCANADCHYSNIFMIDAIQEEVVISALDVERFAQK